MCSGEVAWAEALGLYKEDTSEADLPYADFQKKVNS